MADKVEGNLLAAHQEIQKLGLLYPEGQLEAADVERAVLNVARYDVFGLRDAMLAGDSARTLRMLEGLRAEGEALPLVLWAVGEEIRLLARLTEMRQQGQDTGGAMRRLRIFGAHERLPNQASRACPRTPGRPPCSTRTTSTASSRACTPPAAWTTLGRNGPPGSCAWPPRGKARDA